MYVHINSTTSSYRDEIHVNFGHVPNIRLGNGAGCDQYRGHRRSLLADGEIERHHQAKVNRVDADLFDQRHNDGDHKYNGRHGMQEKTNDKKKDIQHQKNNVLIIRQGHHLLSQVLR